MSSRLTRRALFALPVALPVAAVAAKVGAVVPKAYPYPAGKAIYNRSGQLIATIEELWEPPGVKSPFRFVKTVDMRWRKSDAVDTMIDTLFRSSWGPAKFSDGDLAATLGIKPPQPVVIGIDAGGNHDKVAVAVVQPAQPVVA